MDLLEEIKINVIAVNKILRPVAEQMTTRELLNNCHPVAREEFINKIDRARARADRGEKNNTGKDR